MDLELESGTKIPDATEHDVLTRIEGEEFVILSVDPDSYIQCAEQVKPPYGYILEYQDGSVDEHYQTVDAPISLERVIAGFLKYLRDDPSWRTDFRWESVEL